MAPEPSEKDKKEKMDELLRRVENVEDEEGFAKLENTRMRYLIGYEWDLEEAESRLLETIQWRKERRPLEADCKYCEDQPGFHAWRQVGHDKTGRPVIYSCFAQASTVHYTAEDNVQHLLHLAENAKRSMGPDAYRWVWVLDCTGMTLSACNPRLGNAVNSAMANHYPERLGHVLIVNHSWLFEGAWRAIKIFIHKNTLAKARLARGDKIEKCFEEFFDPSLVRWFLQELRLNKHKPMLPSQKTFWKPPNDPDSHDPRGCPDYVKKYLNPYYKDVVLKQVGMTKAQRPKVPPKHEPHPNYVQEMRERAKRQHSRKSDDENMNHDEDVWID
ncbi:CRAL-TRIO domain-containing protein C3H8.02-like [Anneissia japonica]|uniref:CRAL-TRIO domain-containing protein C3H8.02-like n=1 Tax=Anneissia japonica TaxID=1529436 RepID=UPI0014256EAE|nr:CRAL-TRIO domain-containing protein C3H8.02-like [Anneissia japonica]XP_033122867.1 CRAL-TRIO domain-containing protein C3H8.02-like [Anneissia japonica]XP_033122868.1 CRAL-TRIO domain-containing protein C3H8.02-like [Anneissia japonica]